MQHLLSTLLDFHSVLAGHGYDTGGLPRGEPRGDDNQGGIGLAPIIAVVILTVVTVGLLVWLSPSSARVKLKTVGRGAVIAVIIATPLIAWAASSSGGGEPSLIVERSTALTGDPEFLVSLAEDDVNTLETTNGKRTVRVECLGRDGKVVLGASQKWPFIDEPGYDYPHAHQAASEEQLQRADRCRLRGARVRLEGDVEGALTG